MRWLLALGLVLLAGPASGYDVLCPDSVRWMGNNLASCPCCVVCSDGSWYVEGDDAECPPGKYEKSRGDQAQFAAEQEEDDMNPLLALVLLVAPLVLYFLPTFVAGRRKHPQGTPIFLVNVFLGWTVLGWFVALIWASTAIEKRPAR